MGFISKVYVDGATHLIGSNLYGVCSTAASEPLKQVTLAEFDSAPLSGLTIYVKFTNANTATDPTLKVGSSLAKPIVDDVTGLAPTMSWAAGEIVAFTYDGTNWVRHYDENTTYTFTGGTNQLTITPSNGEPQTISITPSITDNITGSGTSGALAQFDGNNSITAGPTFTNGTEAFLREDGTWVAPPHHEAHLVTADTSSATANAAVSESINSIYLNLIENGSVRNAHNIIGDGSVVVSTNATGQITIRGTKEGTVTSIGVTPNGGLATSTGGAITNTGTLGIAEGGVTNAMLAGSIANTKLVNSSVTIAGLPLSLGGEISAVNLRTNLGLTQALRFIGITSTNMSDGYTGVPVVTGVSNYTPVTGDVVLDSAENAEYVCTHVDGTTYTWELLGRDSSWALDTAVIHNSLLANQGDLLYASSAGNPAALGLGTAGQVLRVNSGATAPEWHTLTKGDIGLDNVTNDAQIPKSIGTTAGDIIYWSGASTPVRLGIGQTGNILAVSSSGVPYWVDPAAASDNLVRQDYSVANNSYPLLFSAVAGITSTEGRGVQTAIVNNTIYANPSTGTITATRFIGALETSEVKAALNIDGTDTTATFFHKSGNWKTLSLNITAAQNGDLVTDVSITANTLPTFTQGTLATATVSQGVLTITSQTADTFTAGSAASLTVTRSNIAIDMN